MNTFAWGPYVRAITIQDLSRLSKWRGYSPEFCTWLHQHALIGLYGRNWALPVQDQQGAIIGTHHRVDRGNDQQPDWLYFPKGQGMRPLIIGDLKTACCIWLFESQWDAFAVMDRLGWHKSPPGETAVVITRGAANGKLVKGLFRPGATVYALKQNDETKNGKNPAEQWLSDVRAHAACEVFHVVTPEPHKDANVWTQAGATAAEIMAAIQDAKVVVEPEESGGGESVENDQLSADLGPSADWFSTVSTGGLSVDRAIYPAGSWLTRYMDFAREREESADSYLIGSIIPILGASLGRRVRFPWGEGSIYPNLFVMLAGKPGDRKSSAINLAERLARLVLEKNQFLLGNLSVEALVDEYDADRAGSPDKLLIADDANPFLDLLQKSNYGERVGKQLLQLYDCKGLGESFRRNKTSEDSTPRRFIPETSTSIVFGATFNVCQFQGHDARSGLQRRFIYYVAEHHGRFLAHPPKGNHLQLCALADRLKKPMSEPVVECRFASNAAELWEAFQRKNRKQLECSDQEAQQARLNGQPMHVLKLAMIFQAARAAECSAPFDGIIELATLETAIGHSNHCMVSAQALDAIGNRASIQADADVLLAKIQTEFRDKRQNGSIVLTRTELTSRYAHHTRRRGALTSDDLYLRLIPDLIRRGKAIEVDRPGKPSAFAFKAEEDL